MQNSNLSDTKILLVEDNQAHQLLFRAIAKKMGINNFDLAENGKQAVEMATRQLYDVILMDVVLPEMDGRAATKEIRNSLGNNVPKIVAYTAIKTGNSDFEDSKIFDGKIQKPATSEDIQRILSQIISQ